MRNWIIGAAAVLAMAAPSVASAQATGYVGAIYANSDTDGADDSDAWGAEGAVAFAGSGSIVFEIDASVIEPDEGDTASAIAGHVYARNDSHLFGGFVGISNAEDSDTWFAGLEANKYFDNWTLAGAVVYANNDDASADGWGVNVEGRVFLSDNFRLNANAGWATIDSDFGDDDAMQFGVGGEYQFDMIPVSIALGYTHTDFDDADFEVDTVAVALRYNWGGTLRDRDRNGASQAGVAGVLSSIS
jgi:hypothetical protein